VIVTGTSTGGSLPLPGRGFPERKLALPGFAARTFRRFLRLPELLAEWECHPVAFIPGADARFPVAADHSRFELAPVAAAAR